MKYILTFLSFLFFINCKSTKDAVVATPKQNAPELTDISQMKKIFELKKGVCFGKCPVYTLTVYDGGMLSYEGKRFTDKMGLYTKKINAIDYRKLVVAFEATDLWQFPDHIKSNIPDLPSTTLTHYKDTKSKSVQWKDGAADQLIILASMMQALTKESGWKADPNSKANHNSNADGIIVNEIIIHLKQGVDIQEFVHQFAKQSMKVKKRIAPNQPMWLVKFDVMAAVPKDMLKWVKSSKGVVNAEFNKVVKMR